jgi:hypothetical protein
MTFDRSAGILFAMKTFNVRDPDRQSDVILDACEREGAVQIRRRNGRTYTLRWDPPQQPTTTLQEWLDEIDERRRRLFPKPLTPNQARELDHLITTEDRVL